MEQFGYYTETKEGGEEFHPFTQIYGGWHIKDLDPDEHENPRCVHVLEMIYNYRIVRSVGECDTFTSGYDRGWCYKGRGKTAFTLAILSAVSWDGGDDTSPLRWNKNVMTGQWYDPPGYMEES